MKKAKSLSEYCLSALCTFDTVPSNVTYIPLYHHIVRLLGLIFNYSLHYSVMSKYQMSELINSVVDLCDFSHSMELLNY